MKRLLSVYLSVAVGCGVLFSAGQLDATEKSAENEYVR